MKLFLLLNMLAFPFCSKGFYLDRETEKQRCFGDCIQALKESNDDFLPWHHRFLGYLCQQPQGLDLIKQIANQKTLWCTKRDHIHILLLNIARGFYNYSNDLEHEQMHTVLDIFLTAAAHHGYPNFVNTVHPNGDSILRASIEHNNHGYAQVALAHKARLDIKWYSIADKQFYNPLEFAHKKFGSSSKMVAVLQQHG